MAETEGFEPSIPFWGYAHLANECLQPLGHVSGAISMPDGGAHFKRRSVATITVGRLSTHHGGHGAEPSPSPTPRGSAPRRWRAGPERGRDRRRAGGAAIPRRERPGGADRPRGRRRGRAALPVTTGCGAGRGLLLRGGDGVAAGRRLEAVATHRIAHYFGVMGRGSAPSHRHEALREKCASAARGFDK